MKRTRQSACRSTSSAMVILLILGCTSIGTPRTAMSELVGYWDFNDSGNIGKAQSGDDLMAFGGASYNSGGKYDGAVNFVAASHQFLALDDGFGGEDTTRVPGNLPLGDGSYTVSAWINLPTSGNSGNGIVGWGGYGTNGQVNATRTANTETGLLNYGWGGSSYDYEQITPDLGDANWHHVAATYDSSTSTKRLYLDGSELGTGKVLTGDLNVQSKNFRIGSTNSGEYFDGRIDDVAIWNKALESHRIESLNNGASPLLTPPVGLWRFDESNNLGKDSSTLGNDLTAQGNAAYAPDGRFLGALSLDGNGDFLTSAAFPDGVPTGDQQYTMAAWIKPDLTGTRTIIGWGNTSNLQTNTVRLNGDNGLLHYWWADDLNGDASGLGVDLDDGQWHHVAATFDGTTRSIWLDGQLLVSDTPSSTHAAAAANFRIGSMNHAGYAYEYFDGLIDEVAVFNLAIGQPEILAIMGGDFTGYGITMIPEPSSLVLLCLGGLLLACGWRRKTRRPQNG